LKAWWRRHRPKVLSVAAYGLVRGIGATLRIRTLNPERIEEISGGFILSGWHGRSFIPTCAWRGRGYHVIISQSRDGQIQSFVFERFGFRTIRGSTGRGGARAAVESIRKLRDGAVLAITPDGPRGPTNQVQPGVILLAQKSGVPIVPIASTANPRRLFSSWDRYMLPLPFGRALIALGEPLFVPADVDEAGTERLRAELEQRMNDLQNWLDARVDGDAQAAVDPPRTQPGT
jgi:lysophospholipid acyltransferase (LPLAT)-like uncharacterized protein